MQARRIWWARAGTLRDCALVVAPCTFSQLVITLRGTRKGNLGGLFVTGAGDRSGALIFMLMYRLCGRRSTLGMVVVIGMLGFDGRCSES